MLRGVCLLADELRIAPVVVHINHQLRGIESDQDADWVSKLCCELRVPCEIVAANVTEHANRRGIGIEEAARDVRYSALTKFAEACGCTTIALAHTADDQAETVLHHILRGTGLTGLRGMPTSRPLSGRVRLIRPLLTVTRSDVESFLRSLIQGFREDRTNRDTSLTRNFLRHELLPLLEERVNSQVREHLLRLSRQVAESQEIVQAQADQLLDAVLLDESPTCVRLQFEPFAKQHRHLVREAFVRLWSRRDWPRQGMTFSHWDALAEFAQNDELKSLNLPGGLTCRRRGRMMVIERSVQSVR